jgi:AI-2 transport protein TqsA
MTRFLLPAACFVVVVAGMRAAESILVPFLMSLFIAVVCSPPLQWLKKKGVQDSLAMLIVIATIVISGVIVGIIVGASISDFTNDLPEYEARLTILSNEVFEKLAGWGVSFDYSQIMKSFNPSAVMSTVGTVLASLGTLITNSFFILLAVVFILAEGNALAEKVKATGNDSKKTMEAIDKFIRSVNQYIAIKSMMSLLTGGVVLIWLWLLGVDYFVLWGLLTFLLNFIPNFGSIIAAVPPMLLATVQLGFGDALLVAAGFLIVNMVVGNILEPRIMGRGLNLSTLVVFMSLVFWGWVLGPVGMLLSVPLTMTVKIALESFDDTRWIGVILGSAEPSN